MTTRPVIPRLAWAIFALLLLSACGTEVATDPAAQSGVEPHDPPPTLGKAPKWRPPAPQHGPCTKAGTALTVGPVEPALGHRAIVVEVRNCGRRTLTFNGYMTVKLLDVQKRPIPVKVVHDSSYMAIDPGPKRIRLARGKHLVAVIAWSATVTDPDPTRNVTATYLTITPSPGSPSTTFKADVDLGNTGKLELTAWFTKLAT